MEDQPAQGAIERPYQPHLVEVLLHHVDANAVKEALRFNFQVGEAGFGEASAPVVGSVTAVVVGIGVDVKEEGDGDEETAVGPQDAPCFRQNDVWPAHVFQQFAAQRHVERAVGKGEGVGIAQQVGAFGGADIEAGDAKGVPVDVEKASFIGFLPAQVEEGTAVSGQRIGTPVEEFIHVVAADRVTQCSVYPYNITLNIRHIRYA